MANQFILSHFVPVVAMKAFFLALALAISASAVMEGTNNVHTCETSKECSPEAQQGKPFKDLRYCSLPYADGLVKCLWCADCGTSCPPACDPPPTPTPVWEYCTTHAKCRNLHKEDRHEFFCHGWTNVTGVCMECTQCHENTSPFSGNCRDACGHDPVHVPNSLCHRDEDCLSQSFCDRESQVHDKESVWHRCSPCSLYEKNYDKHLDLCMRNTTRRPRTDAQTQPPTDAPTDAQPPTDAPTNAQTPSTADRIHKALEDLSKTMRRMYENTERQSKNTTFIMWILVVLLVVWVVLLGVRVFSYCRRHRKPLLPTDGGSPIPRKDLGPALRNVLTH